MNSRGTKAFAGDKIKMRLYVQGWIDPDKPYKIEEIRPNGIVALEGGVCQGIQGIKDFIKC